MQNLLFAGGRGNRVQSAKRPCECELDLDMNGEQKNRALKGIVGAAAG